MRRYPVVHCHLTETDESKYMMKSLQLLLYFINICPTGNPQQIPTVVLLGLDIRG
jgi:hypothetical protein